MTTGPVDSTWLTSRAAFAEAADWFVGTAALVDERWTSAGLGEWDVRSLVGHTSRALLTVESITPGMMTVPAGSFTSRQIFHSCS
jgi:hypothetical protein